MFEIYHGENKKRKENIEGTIKNGQSSETGNMTKTKNQQYVLDTTMRKQTKKRKQDMIII